MNTAKITLTATILAAALGLALGLGAAPALAGSPDEDGCHLDHKEECPVNGGDVTLFDVVLEFLEIPGGTLGQQTRVEDCDGDTDILANPGLTVNFDSGCFVKMHRTSSGAEVEMHLFRLEVKTKGSGIIEIVLNFTTEPEGLTGANLWVTDRLMAVKTPPDDFGEFDLEPSLLMPAAGEILTKGHQPDKGDETEEGLRIGIFTYTPSP